MKREMTLEKARAIISDVTTNVLRWGAKNYGTGPHSQEALLEALVVLSQEDNERVSGQDEEVTKLNRQLAAAKARETKLRKDLAKAKELLRQTPVEFEEEDDDE